MSRPLAIAFLACNKNAARFREDASFLYRCENLAVALTALGHRVSCAHVSSFDWRPHWDAVVLHRPMLTPSLWLLMTLLRRKGVRVVADVDDLIFDPSLAHLSPAVLNQRAELRVMQGRFKRHRQALLKVDLITVSTEPLRQEWLAGLAPQQQGRVLVLPNAVHHSWRSMAELQGSMPPPVLRYLPGTRSHDRDLALIAEPLTQLLLARPQARLEIIGPLECALPLPDHQLIRAPKLPFERYHTAFRGVLANLAPLEPTRFTRGKSALKVIEAAFWGVPTVCSPIPDMRRLQDAGALVAASGDQWFHHLARLLDEPNYRAQHVACLRARVLSHADVFSLAQVWLRELRLGQSPGRQAVVTH